MLLFKDAQKQYKTVSCYNDVSFFLVLVTLVLVCDVGQILEQELEFLGLIIFRAKEEIRGNLI